VCVLQCVWSATVPDVVCINSSKEIQFKLCPFIMK
jgi:hypothetical protein